MPIKLLSFSSDGTTLASVDKEGNILAWEVVSNEEWNRAKTIRTGRRDIAAIAIEPKEKTLSVCHGSPPKITTYGYVGGEAQLPTTVLPTPDGVGRAFSPDARLIVTSHVRDSVHELFVWDIAEKRTLKSLQPGLEAVINVSFSPDGRFLICACNYGAAVFDRDKD